MSKSILNPALRVPPGGNQVDGLPTAFSYISGTTVALFTAVATAESKSKAVNAAAAVAADVAKAAMQSEHHTRKS